MYIYPANEISHLYFPLMKYHIIALAFLISCNSIGNDPSNSQNKKEIVKQQSDFKQLLSSNKTYTLNYKIEEQKNSPVKRFTFYVTITANKKTARNSETVAAEKIFWKDDHTLVILPYVEVMQQSTEVGVNPQPKTILIKIK